MGIFAADYLANLTADLTARVLEAAGHKIGEKVLGTEEEQAVRRCIDAGVWVLMARASGDEPEATELQSIFTAFFSDPGVAHELKKLLRGRSWDRAELTELFAKAGYDAKTLPGLKLEEGLNAFEAAFLAAAAGEPALQGVIQTGSMIEQLHVQQALLDEVKKVVAALPKMQAVRPEIRGGVIRDGHGNVIGDYSQSYVEETYNGPVATGPGGQAIQVQAHIEVPDPAQREADKARIRYLKHLSQRCNVLPLAALGAEEGVGDEVTLDQVYVALDTKTLVPLSEEEKRQHRSDFSVMRGEDNRPLTALEAAIQNRCLVLLGDPGSGKSTFARQVTARLAAAQLDEGKTEPGWEPDLVPFFVSLQIGRAHV